MIGLGSALIGTNREKSSIHSYLGKIVLPWIAVGYCGYIRETTLTCGSSLGLCIISPCLGTAVVPAHIRV